MLKSFFHKDLVEAGCDEAGRGCLAGPVFAAAVVLPKKFRNKVLNDSKQLNDKQRRELRTIIEAEAVGWAVGSLSVNEIDEINILWASFAAMHRAVQQLKEQPQHLLIDGNRFKPYEGIPHTCIIEGDAKYRSIAAASILAKTYRDDYMIRLHEEFPHYNWINNKGYATEEHRDAILAHGLTDHHRKTFRQFPGQLEMDFESEIVRQR
ncbi:MAG TPA: ribonuclease HII [Bacteroidia bacterium]|nr:ribonuclease HII [Bacteroidia bacterium]